MNTVLSLTNPFDMENKENHLDLHAKKMVETASKVIVPIGPITAFAARHPWEKMEQQPFEQVARFLKDMNDVDIYPNDALIKSALDRGEIKEELVEFELQKWIDKQNLELSRDVALKYCRAALRWDEASLEGVSSPQLKNMKKKLNRYMPNTTEKGIVRTSSQLLEAQGRTMAAKDLNAQVIKWCKLYLDETQAVWSMPNREAGFYQSWKRIVPYNPTINPSIRKRLRDLPNEAEQALEEVLIALEIPYADIIEYGSPSTCPTRLGGNDAMAFAAIR